MDHCVNNAWPEWADPGWEGHIPIVITLAIVGTTVAGYSPGIGLVPLLGAAALLSPVVVLLIYLPYLFIVWAMALILQGRSAIRSALRRPSPATRPGPRRPAWRG